MSDDVRPYTTLAELDAATNSFVWRSAPFGDFKLILRLLATCRAGLEDRERLSKEHNPFSLEALDAENEALRADLEWLSQHITNIDFGRYQNGDDIRAIINDNRSTRSGVESKGGGGK